MFCGKVQYLNVTVGDAQNVKNLSNLKLCVCVCVFMNVGVYMCVYIYIYIYIYTHTYVHTYIHVQYIHTKRMMEACRYITLYDDQLPWQLFTGSERSFSR